MIDTGRPIAQVAREIGVGEPLLGRWVARERARDDDPPPALDVDERAELERLRVEVAELRMDSRAITERVAPIVRVAEEAAASDPELAAMMKAVKAARQHEMLASAKMLVGPDGLRVNHDEAAATLYVLYSPQVANMLIGDYGWTPERYENWLARMILQTVIR